MLVATAVALDDFKAWDGGEKTLLALTYEQTQAVDANLATLYPDGITAWALNDLLWFQRDKIAGWLGYKDFDALQNANRLRR